MFSKSIIFLSVISFCLAEDASTDGDVLVLKEENFASTIEEHEFVLVEFYAPWCGHCKALEPEYAKAATTLKEKESKIKLAKVDATEESGLAEKYGVRGYPTIKFFRNGKESEYSGGRKADEIVTWLEKKTGPPAVELESAEKAAEFIKEKEIATIGFFKDKESAEAKAFLETAADMDSHHFGITSDESVFKAYELTKDGIILFKNFDEAKTVFDGEHKLEVIKKFIATHSLPLVVDFSHETAPKIFGGEMTSHLLVFMSKKDGHYESSMDVLKAGAKKHRGDILFVSVNVDEDDHGRILEFFGMQNDKFPALRIIKLGDDMAKYKPDSYDITEENLSGFVQQFLDGKLSQHLMSQELPEDWDSKPVKVLVANNFNEVAMDKTKDVLVEFYAPWCGHCKALAPIFDQLGEKFKDSDSIVIAKMDSTANEIADIKIQSFPTLKLFRKDTNKVIDYSGGRDLDSLVKFLEDPEAADVPAEEPEEEDEEEAPKKEEL